MHASPSPISVALRPFDDSDLPLLETWLSREHVRPWFSDPESWLREVRGRRGAFSFIHHFIALCGGAPAGFCQFYLCADADEPEYRPFPRRGTYSIDYLVGEERFLRRGLGRAIVLELARAVFARPDAALVAVLPDPGNAPSRNTLLSAGFLPDDATGVFLLAKPIHPTPAP